MHHEVLASSSVPQLFVLEPLHGAPKIGVIGNGVENLGDRSLNLWWSHERFEIELHAFSDSDHAHALPVLQCVPVLGLQNRLVDGVAKVSELVPQDAHAPGGTVLLDIF